MTEIILSNKKHGMLVLLLTIVLYILAVLGTIFFADEAQIAPLVLCILYLSLGWLPLLGLKVLGPQEALVLTLFGNYIGTLKGEGFYFVNPFCTAVNPAAKTQMCASSPSMTTWTAPKAPRSWPPWAGARSPCPRRLSPRRSP